MVSMNLNVCTRTPSLTEPRRCSTRSESLVMASHAGWTLESEKEQSRTVEQGEEKVWESELLKVSKAVARFFRREKRPPPHPTLAWCARGCKAHSTKAVTSIALHA